MASLIASGFHYPLLGSILRHAGGEFPGDAAKTICALMGQRYHRLIAEGNRDMTTRAAHLSFPSTHWSAVMMAAGQGSADERAKAIAHLVEAYAPALLAFLRLRKGLDRHHAEDVLQDFLAEKILAQGLISRAERGRGKFRNFLLKSLEHFLYNQIRRDRSAARRPPHGAVQPMVEAADLPDPHQPPHTTFEVVWARNVLALALDAMQHECAATARPEVWAVFDGRVLGPVLRSEAPKPYAQLVEQFRFASPAQASNILITANRMFARCLRAVIGNYAVSEEELENELRDLRRILGDCGAGRDARRVRRSE